MREERNVTLHAEQGKSEVDFDMRGSWQDGGDRESKRKARNNRRINGSSILSGNEDHFMSSQMAEARRHSMVEEEEFWEGKKGRKQGRQ